MSKVKLPPESEVVSWLQQLIEKEELLDSKHTLTRFSRHPVSMVASFP